MAEENKGKSKPTGRNRALARLAAAGDFLAKAAEAVGNPYVKAAAKAYGEMRQVSNTTNNGAVHSRVTDSPTASGNGRPSRRTNTRPPSAPPTSGALAQFVPPPKPAPDGFRAMNPDPRSVRVDFNSGISSGLTTNPLETSSDSWNPLYITEGSFYNLPAPGSRLYTYLTQQVYLNYYNNIQQNFNTKIELSLTEFLAYFNAVSKAVQVYYSIDAVLSYTTFTPNNNDGMIALRRMITADVVSKWVNMTEILVDYTINPNLLHFLQYMYQNFSFSENPTAAVYRVGYNRIYHNTSQMLAEIDTATNELINVAKTNNIIRKARPDLTIDSMPSSYGNIIVDCNWNSFWYNQLSAAVSGGGNTIYTKTHSSETDSLVYSTCDNELDGAMLSCFSSYNSVSNVIEPGVWQPNRTYAAGVPTIERCNLKRYVSSTDSFKALELNKDYVYQAGVLEPWVYGSAQDDYFTPGDITLPEVAPVSDFNLRLQIQALYATLHQLLKI